MSADEVTRLEFVDVIDEPVLEDQDANGDDQDSPSGNQAKPPLNFSLALEHGVEKQYNIDDLQKLSEYLNRESSSRYRAIILAISNGPLDSAHFEVGIVQLRNGDHRSGVVHALGVSPFNVSFVRLEQAFFQYLHSHIYDERTQSMVLEHQQKKQSQKTKNWGEGKLLMSADEAYAAKATADADFVNESEEWIDLTTAKSTSVISDVTRPSLRHRNSSA